MLSIFESIENKIELICKDTKNVNQLRSLLKRNKSVNVNMLRFDGWSIVHLAVIGGSAGLVDFLLFETNANPTVRCNENGVSPLHSAAWRGSVEVVKVLLRHPDVEIDGVSKDGQTALHYAAWSGMVNVCKLLLKSGASDLVQNKDGVTPLLLAIHCNHLPVIVLLVEHAVQKHAAIKSLDNESPFSTVHSDLNGCTGIHHACFEGHEDLLRYLLKVKGFDVHARDKHGRTPLDMCRKDSIRAVVQEHIAKMEKKKRKKNKKDRDHASRSNKERSRSEDTKENNHTSDSGSEGDEHKDGSNDGFRRNSNKIHNTPSKSLAISTFPHSSSPANSSPSKPRGYIRSLSSKMMTPPQSPARSPSSSLNRSGLGSGPRSPSSPAAQRYREKFGPGAHGEQEGGADETDHYSTDEGRLSELAVNRDIEAELALAESAKQKVLLEAEYLAAANNLLASDAISRCWELCADSPSRNNESNEAKSAELLTVLQDHPLLPINTLRDANHCTLLMRASGKGGNSLAVEVLLNCHRHRELPDLPPADTVNAVVKSTGETIISATTSDPADETADLSVSQPPVTAAVATPPVSIARCDVWLTDRHGSTALHHAVMTGNDEVVRLLLSRMGDAEAARFVQTRNCSGCSAVHLAAEHGHLSTLKLLIQYGGSVSALVSAQDNDGFTPLHFACLYSQPDIVHFLVSEAGAAIMSFNIAGELPQDLAKNSVIKRFLTATTQYHSSLNSTAVLTVESKIKTKNSYEAALNALTSAMQAADALKRSSQQQSQFNASMSVLTLKSPTRTSSPTKSKVFTKPVGTPKTPKGSQSARTLPDKYSDVNSSFITTTKVNTARTPRNTKTPTKRDSRENDSLEPEKTPQKSVFSFPSALFDSVLEESEPEDDESVAENNKYSSENNANKPVRDATINNRPTDRSTTRSKGIKSVPKTRPAPAKLTEQSAALAQSLDAEHNATIFKQLYKTMVSDAKKQIASELEQHKSNATGKNKSVNGKNVNTQSKEVEKTATTDHNKPRSESFLVTGNPAYQPAQLHHQQAQRQQSLPERKPSINRQRANSGSVASNNMPSKVHTSAPSYNARSSSVAAPSSQEGTGRLSQQPSSQQATQPHDGGQHSSSQPGPKKRETVGGTFSQNASKQPQSSAPVAVQPAARRTTIAFSNSTKPGPGSPKKAVGSSQSQANTTNASSVTPFQQQRDTISTPEAQQLGRSIANFFQTANSADGGSVESSPPEARVVDLLWLSASSQESSPRVQSSSKVYDSADMATEDRNTTANAVPFSNRDSGGVNERRNDNSVAVSTAAPTTPTAAESTTPRRRSSLSLFSSIFPNFASRSQDTSHSKPPLSRASVPVHASGGMIPESEINTDHVELQVFIGTLNRILDLHVNSTKKMFYRWKHYRGNDAADIIQSRQFNRHPLGTRMQSFSSKPNGSVHSNNSNEYDDSNVMRAGTGIGVAGSGGYLGERSSRLPARQQEPLEVDTTNPHIAFHTASPGSYVSISDLSASTPPQSQPNSEFNSVARSGTDSPYLPFKHAHSTPNTSYRGTNLSFANPYSPEKTLLIPNGKFLFSSNEKLQLCYSQIEPLVRANEVPLGAIYTQFSVSSREGMTEVDAWNFLLCFELAPAVVSKTQLVEFVRSTLRSRDIDSGATDLEVEPVVYNSPPPPNQRRFSVSGNSGGKKPLGGSASGGHRRASMGSAGESTNQALNFVQFVKVLWLVSGLCGNQRQGQQTPEMQFAMLLYIMDSSGGRRKIVQANRTSTTIPSFSYLNTLVTK